MLRRLAVFAAVACTALLAAAPAQAAEHGIALYVWGASPSELVIDRGDVVHFTNYSGQERRIVDTGGLLDSGPLPSGGGYSVAVTAPGVHEYTWTGVFGEDATATIRVRVTELAAPPTEPIEEHVPDALFPPEDQSDVGIHPVLGLEASRTRILVRFAEGATVAEANAALAAAGVEIVGALPAFEILLVSARDNFTFGPLDAALAALRASPAVEIAAMSPVLREHVTPRRAKEERGLRDWNWKVDDQNGEPVGDGGNWGLEASRFPQAWNFLEEVERRQKIDPTSNVRTAVLDTGFHAHPDLSKATHRQLCSPHDDFGNQTCTWMGSGDPKFDAASSRHAVNVAGVIGADFNNPSDDGRRSKGVSGANPVALLDMSSYFIEDPRSKIPPSKQLADALEVWHWLLDEAPGRNVKIVNFSAGVSDQLFTGWWRTRPRPTCGPGDNDDPLPTTNDWCTPANDDGWLRERDRIGRLALLVANRAAARGVTIVQSAGNVGAHICDSKPSGANHPCDANPPLVATAIDTAPFAWASEQLKATPAANPVILVESIQPTLGRDPGTNVGGHVSAPGVGVLTTTTDPDGRIDYALTQGTSIAAPHVAGLAGYLLAFDPTLTPQQIRARIVAWARPAKATGDAPRIDAFAAMMASPGAAKLLVDVADRSRDGRLRVVLGPDNKQLELDTSPMIPDRKIDMRDFRAFRDAWLQGCQIDGTDGCPGDITLNGPRDHPKRDLNGDGCSPGSASCDDPVEENRFPRFDFNGDGKMLRRTTFKVPLRTDGQEAGRADEQSLTDLGVLKAFYKDTTDEGWSGNDLDALLESGDLEIHADKLFEGGATQVDVSFTYGGTLTIPKRTLRPAPDVSKQFLVATVPAKTEVTLDVVVHRGPDSMTVAREKLELKPGEDRRLDLCQALALVADPRSIPADGEQTIELRAKLGKCRDADSVSGKTVTFTAEPPAGVTITPAKTRTDANGNTAVKLSGTQVGPVLVKATADLGNGRSVTYGVEVELTKKVEIAYVWKQRVEEWSEEGSTNWEEPPAASASPDCELAPVEEIPYCIDTFRIELVPDAVDQTYGLTRKGKLAGGGERFKLSQTVENTVVRSKATWHVTSRRDGWKWPGGRTVTQEISDPDAYSDHAFDKGELFSFEYGDSLYVYGLQWVGDLPYHYERTQAIDEGTTFTPKEIHAAPDRLILVPQEESIRFHGPWYEPLVFTRPEGGSFSDFASCFLLDRDISQTLPSWYDPWGDEWGGVVGRTRDYVPGLLPMPIGTGRLKIRYAFAAVAWYAGETPREPTLPDCSQENPPSAEFDATPLTALEGRQVHFFDRSLDPEHDISSWRWDFGDGTTSTEESPHHMFADNGTYEVSLTVSDSGGRSDTMTHEVEVANVAPEANIEDVDGVAGQELAVEILLVDASKIDKAELEYAIESTNPDWPTTIRGTIAAGDRRIRFPAGLPAGIYPLTLTVTDKDGAEAIADAFLVVAASPRAACDPATGENCTVAAPPPEYATCDATITLDAQEHQFLVLLNAYRAQNGLVPVTVSPTLTKAAEVHAHDMAVNDFMAHIGTDGSDWAERAWREGYPPRSAVSENVARGAASGFAALQAWKSSQTGHNENMLDPAWRAIGIAREQGTEWKWATSFGKLLDCPQIEIETIAVEEGEETAPAVGAATSTNPLTHAPLAALAITDLEPRAKQDVVFRNRARDGNGEPVAATLDPGDGTAPVAVEPDGEYVHRYTAPYQKTAKLTATDADGREQTVTRALWVEPPPTPFVRIEPAGWLEGYAGRTIDVRAVATSSTGVPIAGLDLTFTLEGRVIEVQTGPDGKAAATVSLAGIAAGYYALSLRFEGNDDWAFASTASTLRVIQNHAPEADAGGPYVVGSGKELLLDGTGSWEPDYSAGDRIVSYEWDVDGDGEYGDLVGATPPPLVWEDVQARVCGGVCFTDTTYTIKLEVTDSRGDSGVATASARFTSDFALSLGGEGKTIVPGASNSFAVSVVGSGGFSSPVTLSVVGLPAGVTGTFSVNPVTPSGLSVLTISATSAVGDGTFPIVVTGTSGDITRTVSDEVDVAFGLIPVCWGTYTGTVRDKTTGAPVAGASVNADFTTVTTDANGRYTIHGIRLGSQNAPRGYSVQVTKTGYWQGGAFATAACGVPTVVDIQLLAQQPGKLSGSVVLGIPDPNNHFASRTVARTTTPLAGVSVSASAQTPATTGADGRYDGGFSLNSGNTPRFHQVTASLAGYWPQTKNVTLDLAAPKTLDFELVQQCYGKIRGGVVRWADTGEVVPGASVAYQFTISDRGTMVTNANGEYDFNKEHLLGLNNSTVFFTLKPTPPAGSPAGAAGQTVNVSLADCGSETGSNLVITRPKVNRATLQGYVRNKDTLAPIPNAWVSYGTLTTQADGNGFYRFADVLIGFDNVTSMNKVLSASAPGFYAWSFSQTITAGGTFNVDVPLLQIRYASASGVVKDVVTGVPIPDAEVGCWDPAPLCTHSGRDGSYSDTDIVVGANNTPITRNVKVSAEGYWPLTAALKFEAGLTTARDFELMRVCPTARISGRVVDAETQEPIWGAWVQGGGRDDITDEFGRFVLDDVVPGSGNGPLALVVTAQATGYIPGSKNVTVFCGANITLDFGSRQNNTGVIIGSVVNLDTGAPLANVFVGTEFGGTAKTDSLGNYRISAVPLGDLDADREWNVTAVATGFKQQTKAVVARAGVEVRADFAFTVAGNLAPTAEPQQVTGNEDSWFDVTLAGGDEDGDALIHHVMRYPEHGTLQGSPPNVRYRPDDNYNGADAFTFATHDGLAMSEHATVDIVVTPVNDPPYASFDNLTADEETPLVIDVADLFANDRDADNDVLLLDSFAKSDVRFTLTRLGDTLLFTPLPGLTGNVYFTYTVTDGHGAYSSAWVAVNVRNVPGAPLCGDTFFTGPRDTPLIGTLTCTDRDGDALTYALVEAPEHGSVVVAADGRFTYTPTAGFRGGDAFTFTASDAALVSRAASALLTIGPNHPPQASDASLTLDEDTTIAVTLAADDADDDALTFSVLTQPQHGTLTGEAPNLTYTPQPGFYGADSFTFVVSDGIADSEQAAVAIAVQAVNDATEAADDATEGEEDRAAVLAVLENDSAGIGDEEQSLAVTTVTQPAHGLAFPVAGGSIFYLPAANWHGDDAFSYTVCDDGSPSSCATAQVAVTVEPMNDRPAAGPARVALDEDAPPVTIDLADFVDDVETADPDLAYVVVAQPQHGSLSGSGRTLAYDSDDDVNGSDSLTFRVTDRGDPDACLLVGGCSPPLASTLRTVLIAIKPVNDTPQVALDAPASVPADATAQLRAIGTDVDGDLLTFTWSADGGTLDPAGPAATLASDVPGDIRVTAKVSDGHAEAAVNATVTFENTEPQVDAGADVGLDEGSAVTLAASFTDPGDDGHTIAVDWGDGSAPANALDASHAYADDGSYTVTVRVTDGDGGVGEDTLTVTVNNVAPQVDAGADATIDEGETLAPAAAFIDPGSADAHSVSVDWGDGSSAAGGLDAPHVYTDDGSYTVTVRVTDDEGGVGEDTRAVTVRNVKPAVTELPQRAVDEGDDVELAFAFTDPGADTHEAQLDWGDGTIDAGAAGTHRYVDDGAYTVEATVVDDDGGRGSAGTLVTVRNVAPRVDAGPDRTADEGSTVTLAAAFGDRGSGDTHTISVDWGDGAGASSLDAAHAYADDGTYTVTVAVADDDGGIGSDTLRVTVRNVAPAVDAGPDVSLDEGGTVDLAASLADPGTGDTHTVSIDWADGTTGADLSARHRYEDNGTYPVVVTARDDDGGAGSDRLDVTVRNVAPTVDAGPDRSAPWGVPLPFIGIVFDPSAVDTAAGFSGRWRFGDGEETTNLAELHAYALPGDYQAVLSVADKDGGSASDSVAVTIAKRPTRLVYTGPSTTPFGSTLLSARLEDIVDAPSAKLAGKTVRFTINGATFTALTDATGAAAVTPRVTGGTVTVDFPGDGLYLAAQTQTELTVTYSFGGNGFFAIGDGDVALGADVTFWDAQWWKENTLTGDDGPVASFKGWVARDAAPACGQSWTTSPGNSGNPPASVPPYLAVAVASRIDKSGSAVTGDTIGVVVVETGSGYGPSPGHVGTGTVIARVC